MGSRAPHDRATGDADPVAAGIDRPERPARGPAFCRRRLRHRRFAIAVIVGTCVAGAVALRLYFAVGPHTSPDSDEAIVGLMAVRLLRHGIVPPAFYWSQTYGGSLESIAVAPFIALLGTTTLGLRSASILFELLTSWLVWRVARHLFRTSIAACVGVVSLFFPLLSVMFGTRERGFYPLTAALGFAAVLMAVNIHEHPSRSRYWVGLGLAIGVGWWMSPNIIYYALPVTLWLVTGGHWRPARNVVIATVAFVLGSSVWIVANIHSGFGSVLRPPNIGGSSTYAGRFAFFWTDGLPFALGLRAPGPGQWYVQAGVAIGLYALMLVVFVFALRGTRLREAPDVFLLAASPFVFATFIGNWQLIEGRYVYFVASMIPFAIGRVIELPAGRVVAAALVTVSTLGFVAGYGDQIRATPGSTEPLARALAADGFHTAMGTYWNAFKMTYQSDELVIVSPFPTMPGSRYKPYARAVYDSWPAYVYNTSGPQTEAVRLINALDHRHITFGFVERGSYYALIPRARYVPTRGPP